MLVGWTTTICVESTLRDASFRDYRCLVLADCTGEMVGPDGVRTYHDVSLLTFQRAFGSVSESTELLNALAPLVMAAQR